jgi:hypothetical protein
MVKACQTLPPGNDTQSFVAQELSPVKTTGTPEVNTTGETEVHRSFTGAAQQLVVIKPLPVLATYPPTSIKY